METGTPEWEGMEMKKAIHANRYCRNYMDQTPTNVTQHYYSHVISNSVQYRITSWHYNNTTVALLELQDVRVPRTRPLFRPLYGRVF